METSGDRRHHCPNCGIRTHSSFMGTELKNDDVHYGTCIKCNPKDVPASVRKEWKQKNPGVTAPPRKSGPGNSKEVKPGSARNVAKNPAGAGAASPKPGEKQASARAASPKPGQKPASARAASPKPGQKAEKKDVWARPGQKPASSRSQSPGSARNVAKPASARAASPKPGEKQASARAASPKPGEKQASARAASPKPGQKPASAGAASPKPGQKVEKKDVWARPGQKPASTRAASPGSARNVGPKQASARAGSPKPDQKPCSGRNMGQKPASARAASPGSSINVASPASERRHHCPTCGIRTHMGAVGLELKNDDVHYGTCIKCNLKDVPPSIAQAWKDKNAGIVPEVEDVERERMHHCDKCGIRTHRSLGFEIKNEEVHYGTCIKCYPKDVPPSILKTFNETKENNERQHHCDTCGIRTHSTILGTELKNENVHYGTCIKCNLKDIPPPIRQKWKKLQKEKEEEETKKSLAKDPNSPKPRLADQIIEKERRERASREGMCPDCFKVRTHNVTRFNREARKNVDVFYGVCIACHPDDPSILPAARKAWEEKHKNDPAPEEPKPTITSSPAPQDSTGAPVASPTVIAVSAPVVTPTSSTGSPSSPPVADSIVEKERREAIEKQGRCPDCGIMTHKTTRFSKEPLKNLDVYHGVCIRCNDDGTVPSTVRKAWEEKQELSGATVEKIDVKEGDSPEKPRAGMMQGSRFASVPMFAEDPSIKGLDPVLKAKVLTPVSLGWNKDEQHVFDHVIAFCSHAKRSKEEKQEDKKKFGGIDRRVFSNLFVDDEPLVVAPNAELLGHAALFTEGLCAQSFYMAAKCKNEWDARFIMTELKKASHVERYGHNRLELSEEQKEKLIGYGADPSDFKKIDDSGSKWLCSKSGKMPTRDDWYEVRHNIVLHILRNKFGGTKGTKTQKTAKALSSLITDKGEIPILTEHRSKDAFWGDAKFGSGYSVLGKTITQVMLEITDKVHPAPFLSKAEASVQLFKPNSEIVGYEWPMEETEESSDSN